LKWTTGAQETGDPWHDADDMFWPERRHAAASVFLVLLFCAGGRPLAAQESAQTTTHRSSMTTGAVPHPFLDNTNALLTGVEIAALIGDASSTRRVLDEYPGVTAEGDPLARPFVEHGWPGQIAGGVLFVTAELLGRYALHAHGHHRMERMLPLIVAGLEFGVTVHNVQGLHALDREAASGLLR
jgi:hypothetical protein